MADDHALDFGPRLPILTHEPRTLIPQLPTNVRLCVPSVELSRVRSSMHHEVLLRTPCLMVLASVCLLGAYVIAQATAARVGPCWYRNAVPVVHIGFGDDINYHGCVLG